METRFKYSRTMNFPWSQSNSSDDVWLKDCSHFENKKVIVSEKLDGESSGVYSDGYSHARSVDSVHHPSRSWVKQLFSEICHNIPKGWRIYGENMYAWHSIFYKDLPTYFFVYGIYDDKNFCLPWQDTKEFCQLLGLRTVPVIYQGIWDEKLIKNSWNGKSNFPTFRKVNDEFVPCEAEGYVVRTEEGFHRDDFSKHYAKYVGPQFKVAMRDVHWATAKVVPNQLKESKNVSE